MDLLDGEIRVDAGDPDVACGDQVDGATDAGPMDRRDHRKSRPLDRGEGVLERQDQFAHGECCASGFVPEEVRDAGESGEVHAAAEMPAFAGNHRATHGLVAPERGDDARQAAPEPRRHTVRLVGLVHDDAGYRPVAFDPEEGALEGHGRFSG